MSVMVAPPADSAPSTASWRTEPAWATGEPGAPQKREQRVVPATLELEPRRHGVAAAFDQQPFMDRAAHHRAEIDRGDRAGRPGGETVGFERGDEGRQAEALGDAAGDQAEQALVPALGGEEQQRPRRIGGKLGVGDGEGFLEHALFDRLAFGIERLELGGDAARLDLVVGRQQPGAEAGAPTLPPALMRGPRMKPSV